MEWGRLTHSQDSANTTIPWFNLEMYKTPLEISEETSVRVINVTIDCLSKEFALIYYNFRYFKFDLNVSSTYGIDMSTSISKEQQHDNEDEREYQKRIHRDSRNKDEHREDGFFHDRRLVTRVDGNRVKESKDKNHLRRNHNHAQSQDFEGSEQIKLNDQSRYMQTVLGLELGTAVTFVGYAVFFNQPIHSSLGVYNDIMNKGNSPRITAKLSQCLRDTDDPSLEDITYVKFVPYPTEAPSMMPSQYPTLSPSQIPSQSPSFEPSLVPSVEPSIEPSIQPTNMPSSFPSSFPSEEPIAIRAFPSIILGLFYFLLLLFFLRRRKDEKEDDKEDYDDDLSSLSDNMSTDEYIDYIYEKIGLTSQEEDIMDDEEEIDLDAYYKKSYYNGNQFSDEDYALNTAKATSAFLQHNPEIRDNKKREATIAAATNTIPENTIFNLDQYHIGDNGEITFDGDQDIIENEDDISSFEGSTMTGGFEDNINPSTNVVLPFHTTTLTNVGSYFSSEVDWQLQSRSLLPHPKPYPLITQEYTQRTNEATTKHTHAAIVAPPSQTQRRSSLRSSSARGMQYIPEKLQNNLQNIIHDLDFNFAF